MNYESVCDDNAGKIKSLYIFKYIIHVSARFSSTAGGLTNSRMDFVEYSTVE